MMKNKLNQLLERSFEVLNQNKVLNKVYKVVNEFDKVQSEFIINHLQQGRMKLNESIQKTIRKTKG